ncbi:hypothetical protein ACWEFL_33530 [Streptomyces sp. NPDC004838]
MSLNGMQQSNESDTRKGIQALEMAFTQITQSRQGVENTRNNLMAHYQGADGGAFGQLVEKWEANCNTVLFNVQDMIEALNQTLVEHGKQQGSAVEEINQAYTQSDAIFDQLRG